MELPNDLISQFVKITNDKPETRKETTVFGTVVEYNGSNYVRIDGSDRLTPVTTTADMIPGERVTVMIKNHTATVTGNISSPSARTDDVKEININAGDVSNKISEFEIIIADKVSTADFDTEKARIDELYTDNVSIKQTLSANSASIKELNADNVTIKETLIANDASIETLKTTKLDAEVADLKYATIEGLEATDLTVHNLKSDYAQFASTTTGKFSAIDGSIQDLEAKKLSAEDAKLTYANIDFSNIGKAAIEYFYTKSGLIENIVVGDGTITGKLVGVTITGDLIEGNTIKAEKLVIKGTDGLYYKLNTDGMTTEAEQTDQNSLNGSVIMAKSITATKINVDDLVAFDATIGGFNITDSSLYSGVKSSVENTTRGIYLDDDGQMVVGDESNFIKYYKDADGNYKLAISAESILFGASKKSVEAAIVDVQSTVDNIEVGGRNLLLDTNTAASENHILTWAPDGSFDVSYSDGIITLTNETGLASSYFFYGNGSMVDWLEPSTEYVASFDIMLDIDTSIGIMIAHTNGTNGQTELVVATPACVANEWTHVVAYLTAHDEIPTDTELNQQSLYVAFGGPVAKSAQIKNLKLEKGNKATDWTPAPEDMATAESVEETRALAESVDEKVHHAESLIQQLSDSISMLVTDGNGTSLMTQTDTGWTFSTAEIQTAIDTASQNLDALNNSMDSVNGTVDVLQQAVDDLGVMAEYVKIGTYEDEPCIELGEGDSDFKLLITNTRIMFMEGSGVPAYITNQSLHIKKAVIEEELQQGGFVWKVRSNGNMGLVWKGVTE